MIRVGVLDYGSGNLHSATRALAEAGADVVVGTGRDKLWKLDALVVPGVGSYAGCMAGLRSGRGAELILDWVSSGRKLLGICVGHQVLYQAGTEHGVTTEGLGIHPGRVERLETTRLPHMGWSQVNPGVGSQLFKGLAGERFYFVHSYAVAPTGSGTESTCCHEDTQFVAAVETGMVCSTQFHPEKSSVAGLTLLKNWLASS